MSVALCLPSCIEIGNVDWERRSYSAFSTSTKIPLSPENVQMWIENRDAPSGRFEIGSQVLLYAIRTKESTEAQRYADAYLQIYSNLVHGRYGLRRYGVCDTLFRETLSGQMVNVNIKYVLWYYRGVEGDMILPRASPATAWLFEEMRKIKKY